MIVERIWTDNAYRNYNYLIACANLACELRVSAARNSRARASSMEPRSRARAIVLVHSVR